MGAEPPPGAGGTAGDRTFLTEQAVRFGWCDPAGIVYYPKYFDLFHEAMESWFNAATGLAYADFIRQGRGMPTVHAEADYRAPLRLGETFILTLTPGEPGRSSLAFDYVIEGSDGGTRATGRVVTVLMDLEPGSPTHGRALPWPPSLRAAIQQWRTGGRVAG